MIPASRGPVYQQQLQEFLVWVDKQVGLKHLTARCARDMKEVFTGRLQHATPGNIAAQMKVCMDWADAAECDGHITHGNVRFVRQKLDALFAAPA